MNIENWDEETGDWYYGSLSVLSDDSLLGPFPSLHKAALAALSEHPPSPHSQFTFGRYTVCPLECDINPVYAFQAAQPDAIEIPEEAQKELRELVRSVVQHWTLKHNLSEQSSTLLRVPGAREIKCSLSDLGLTLSTVDVKE